MTKSAAARIDNAAGAARRPVMAQIRELIRFAAVGGAATLLYAVLTWTGIKTLHAAPALASAAAYLLAALFSFLGHRYITFLSTGSHVVEAAKFVFLTACGLAVATGVMQLAGALHWPTIVGIVIVSGAIPIINFFVLKLWVVLPHSRT